MRAPVGIVGFRGYSGAELVTILSRHSRVEPVLLEHRHDAGERPEPQLGDFRAGLYMTRFFSELVLSAGDDGTLEPFAEELPEPISES